MRGPAATQPGEGQKAVRGPLQPPLVQGASEMATCLSSMVSASSWAAIVSGQGEAGLEGARRLAIFPIGYSLPDWNFDLLEWCLAHREHSILAE